MWENQIMKKKTERAIERCLIGLDHLNRHVAAVWPEAMSKTTRRKQCFYKMIYKHSLRTVMWKQCVKSFFENNLFVPYLKSLSLSLSLSLELLLEAFWAAFWGLFEPLGPLWGRSWGLLGDSWWALEVITNNIKTTYNKRLTSRPQRPDATRVLGSHLGAQNRPKSTPKTHQNL